MAFSSTDGINWAKTLGAGVVAGIVVSLVNYLLHGVVMADTYRRYSAVFSQEQASLVWFFLVAIAIGVFFAILFAKTRQQWAAGVKGGVSYGFWWAWSLSSAASTIPW